MISKKTVLILGAGASVDLGYPTGAQLIRLIHNKHNEALMEYKGTPSHSLREHFSRVYDVISKVQIKNIDTFLRDNLSLENEGKRLIAYLLLKKESRIAAIMNSFLELKQDSSWLLYLFDAVTRSCNSDVDLISSLENLRIITFNYDVSVEAYFLSQFIQQEKYQAVAQNLMNHLEVIHIYGLLYTLVDKDGAFKIGNYAAHEQMLDKHSKDKDVSPVTNYQTFIKAGQCANNLHVVGEKKQGELAKSKHIATAKSYLSDAKAIHAIGFAFDSDNLALLQDPNINWSGKRITYTNFDKSEQLKTTARQYFINPEFLSEFDCSAYDAAANRIAW